MRFVRVLALVMVLCLMMATSVIGVEASPSAGEDGKSRPTPKLPIIVDGTRYAPSEITRFADKETLYYVYDAAAEPEGVLLIFTSQGAFDRYLRDHEGILPSALPSASSDTVQQPSMSTGVQPEMFCSGTDVYAQFSEDIWYDGASLSLSPGEYLGDLTATQCGNFNDRISSIAANPANVAGVRVWEHVHQGGDVLHMDRSKGNMTYADLVLVGWNDRGSSVYVW